MPLEQPSNDSSIQSSSTNRSRKRPVSERKIQANRRNALRSTGPTTARGKRTVSRNAIKHGLLAREVVITAGDGEESAEEFHDLVEKLCEDYKPVGFVEESLVQTIAVCWWRKARVIRAENGELRKRLDTVALDRASRSSDKANLALFLLSQMELDVSSLGNQADQISTMKRWSAMQEDQRTLREHPAGLTYLSLLLEVAKSQMAGDGYISETVRTKIVAAFGLWDFEFAFTCANAGPPEERKEDRISEKSLDQRTDEQRLVVAFIDSGLETISVLQGNAKEGESLTLDAEARSFSLPPVEASDKLLRYEAHLDRQLYRAMDQLERLQRQRRGETVPPPLNVNLGRRN